MAGRLLVTPMCLLFVFNLCTIAYPQAEKVGDLLVPDSVGVHSSGTITEEDSKGNKYTVEFYGDAIIDTSGSLNNSLIQGKGQYIVSKNLLVTSETVAELTDSTLTVQVGGKAIAFCLTKNTQFCDGTKSLKKGEIARGDMVTITSKLGHYVALTIRKGPMLFSGLVSPPLVLRVYRCEH
jgi:hypothetical protein